MQQINKKREFRCSFGIALFRPGLAAWLVVAKQIVLLSNIGEVIIIIKIIAFILERFATRVTCNFLS
jgi:hypothetical protein